MPNNFHQKLIDLLKDDKSLWDEEDELIIAAIHRRARQLDHDLVRLLLSDDEIKAEFLYRMRRTPDYQLSRLHQQRFQERFSRQFRYTLSQQNTLKYKFKYLRERGELDTLKRKKASPIPFTAN